MTRADGSVRRRPLHGRAQRTVAQKSGRIADDDFYVLAKNAQ